MSSKAVKLLIESSKKISKFDIIISTIARGVPIGDEIEYADEVTLGRSILQRVPFSSST